MNVVLSRIPTRPEAQTLSVDIGAVTYRFRLVYAVAKSGRWVLDIRDADDVPIICGIPLVTGINLLGQHAYLGLGFGLYVGNTDGTDDAPTFEGLGTVSNLYLVRVQ